MNWKPVSNCGAEVPANRVSLHEALISGRPLVLVDAKTGSRIATRVVTVFDDAGAYTYTASIRRRGTGTSGRAA